MPHYRSLDPGEIVRTLEALNQRIEERFPGAGWRVRSGRLHPGVAVFFLVTLETRVKRRRALHELRVIAHIIDMHQLTKDPERMTTERADMASSPRRAMTPAELGRYLDYCSELLSLTGKIAALYVQRFPDTVAVATVNEIEDLTTGLSRKIWQKLMILHGGR
jgi:hypothetical protein